MGSKREIRERLHASRESNPFRSLVLEALRHGNYGSGEWSHYDVNERVWQLLTTKEIGHPAVKHMNLFQAFSRTIGVKVMPWRRYTSQEIREAIKREPGRTRDSSRLSQEMTTLVSRVLRNLAKEGFIDYKGRSTTFWCTQKPLPEE